METKIVFSLMGHTDRVRYLAFNHEGLELASAGGHEFMVWDVKTGGVIREVTGVSTYGSFSPDQHLCIGLQTSGLEKSLDLWDLVGDQRIGHYQEKSNTSSREDWERQLTLAGGAIISSDGKLAATGISRNTRYGYDKGICIWQLPELQRLRQFGWNQYGHHFDYHNSAFLPHTHQLLAGMDELILWDADSGKELRRFPSKTDMLALSEDGRTAVTMPNTASNNWIHIWDIQKGVEVGRITEGKLDDICSLSISHDKNLVAAGHFEYMGSGAISVWYMATSKEAFHVKLHNHSVDAIAFSPDGRLVASGDGDGMIYIWSLPDSVLNFCSKLK
jgi:WD40 repeat protein